MKDIPFDMFTDRRAALVFHLTVNFYPRPPEPVVDAMVGEFNKYWEGNQTHQELEQGLKDNAGYIGGLDKYDFWQFLFPEDQYDRGYLGE